MMAPYEADLALYRLDEMRPLGRVTLRPRPVNWKNIADNYADGLHITVAHPGLTRLFGRRYGVEAKGFVQRMWGDIQDGHVRTSSEKAYREALPRVDNLTEDRQRHRCHFKFWRSEERRVGKAGVSE